MWFILTATFVENWIRILHIAHAQIVVATVAKIQNGGQWG